MAGKNDNKTTLGIVLLVLMFVAFVLFRQLYQKGAKLLNGLHPWDWIALVVILALLGVYSYRANQKAKK